MEAWRQLCQLGVAIGKLSPEATAEEILTRTREVYLKETGFGGGQFQYLGRTMIETGKYRGAGPGDHGLAAHMFLATDLRQIADAREPTPTRSWRLCLFLSMSSLRCWTPAISLRPVPCLVPIRHSSGWVNFAGTLSWSSKCESPAAPCAAGAFFY